MTELSDVLIAHGDGLGIVVQLLLNGGDELLDLVLHVLAEGEARLHLAVTLGSSTANQRRCSRLGNIRDQLLNLGDGVLDGTLERTLCGCIACLCRLLGSLDQLLGALALDGAVSTTGTPSSCDSFFYVDHVAALLDNIHHVQRDNDRNAHLEQLGGQVQVARSMLEASTRFMMACGFSFTR